MKYRNHTDEFKYDLITRIDSGEISIPEAARKYDISASLIKRWRDQIHEGTMKPHKTKREKELEKELERYKIKVAELTLANDLLKKLHNSVRAKRSNGYVVTPKKSDQSEKPVE